MSHMSRKLTDKLSNQQGCWSRVVVTLSGKAPLSRTTACSCFPSQAGRTPESHQQRCSSGTVHVQNIRSYLMGKDGRGNPEGMWGNRRGFSAMQVPNGNTQIPSCLGSHTSGLSQIPVFPFRLLLDLSKLSPSLGDKNLNPACSYQLQYGFPAASYTCQAESLLTSVLDHYPKRTIAGGDRVLKNIVK